MSKTVSLLAGITVALAAGCAANPPPPPTATETTISVPSIYLPGYVCPAEEDSPGYWDAQLCGNGAGTSVQNPGSLTEFLDSLLDERNYE